MSARRIILVAVATAFLLSAVLLISFRPQVPSAVRAEIDTLVKKYDDAMYNDGDYESAKIAAKRILQLSTVADDSRGVEVRGLVRLAYLEIVFGKWGNHWGNKLKKCRDLISECPTIARAEYLLYLGSIRGKWQGKFDEGLEKIQEALWIANHNEDDRTLALAYTRLSELHVFLKQRNLVARNAYRGLTIAKSHGQKSIIVRALRSLINNLVYLGKTSEAAECGRQLFKLKPNSIEAMYILYQIGESNNLEEFTDNRIKEVNELNDKGQSLGNRQSAKFGKLLTRMALGHLHRNEFSKCRERVELAIPYIKASGDKTTFSFCMNLLNAAHLEQADNVEKVDKIAATFDNESDLLDKTLAFAYAKVGELEKSLYWKQRAVELQEKRQADEIGFLRQSSEQYWQSELRLREQTASSNQIVERSTRRIWFLSTVLTLGLTVSALLGGFYYLLRRERNSLDELVQLKTMSLSMAIEKANAADRAKSDFLAQINHEIRNPLTAILSYCDLLTFSPNHDRSSEFVAGIESSSQHLRKLIDEILEVSKIESSDLEVDSIEFFPERTVSDVNGIIAEQATRKGLTLNCDFIGDQSISILSDETKIRQIALNLIGNAIKFTQRGSVNATFELKDSDSPTNAKLVITVKDSGVGIPEGDTASIFDRFTKASNGSVQDGSGLGLYIVRHLANSLDGDITLHSKLDVGTKAIVSLPVKVNSRPIASLQTSNDCGQDKLKDRFFNSAKRVLVIDDQEMIRTSLKLQLNGCGLACETTDELEQAIELIENWHPDLVLLDLRMPKHSGFEVLERIRASSSPDVPVHAITGDATNEVKQKCFDHGFNGYITKPFKISTILEVLETYTEKV